ncbi:unnamed protein product [Pleuronectes platessa]|uniref:Uncharacterized protein n=1 Tax=Pleuronectes platessa TaxID=8262 RepID=A0A9N7UQ15_PLEPL|nr:unnamed protein product [Pleuronectes platessa]
MVSGPPPSSSFCGLALDVRGLGRVSLEMFMDPDKADLTGISESASKTTIINTTVPVLRWCELLRTSPLSLSPSPPAPCTPLSRRCPTRPARLPPPPPPTAHPLMRVKMRTMGRGAQGPPAHLGSVDLVNCVRGRAPLPLKCV